MKKTIALLFGAVFAASVAAQIGCDQPEVL